MIYSPIEMFRFWNYQVHIWLKYYIAHRLTPPGEKAGKFDFAIVFSVSAFWHGFYLSYYLSFFFSALICEIAKDIFKARSLFTWIPKPLRWIIANQLTMYSLDYFFVVVNAQTTENVLFFFNATYWNVVWLPFIVFGITRGFGLAGIARKYE